MPPAPISAPAQNIVTLNTEAPVFSICSLVTQDGQYQTLLNSFQSKGFVTPKVEYLYVDNRLQNHYDGFSGLAALIARAKGDYIILCHQDVRLLEAGFAELVQRLQTLDDLDPHWALAGNAGCTADGRGVICISDRFQLNNIKGPFPQAVVSLDENFIILKRSAQLAPSVDLKGFHLYGTDLCLQAAWRGHTAYVIDFHLHHDCGVLKIDDSYFDVLEAMEQKYHRLLQTRRVRTTCHAPLLTGFGLGRLWSQAKINKSRLKTRKKALKKRESSKE